MFEKIIDNLYHKADLLYESLKPSTVQTEIIPESLIEYADSTYELRKLISHLKSEMELLNEEINPYQNYFENLPISILIHDENFKIIKSNINLCNLLNQLEINLAGKSLYNFVVPESTLTLHNLTKNPENINSVFYEDVIITTNIQPRKNIKIVSTKLNSNKSNNSILFLSVLIDLENFPKLQNLKNNQINNNKSFENNHINYENEIAKLKSIISDFENKAEFLRNLFDHLPFGLCVAERNNLKIIDVNNYLAALLGYDKNELCEKTVYDITYPEDMVFEIYSVKNQLNKAEKPTQFKRYIKKNGELISCKLIIADLFDSDNSQFLGIIEEISDNEQILKSLDGKDDFLKLIVGNINDVILITDLNGTINFVTDSLYKIFGFETSEVLSKSIFQFIHPDDLDLIKQDFNNIIIDAKSNKTIRVIDKLGLIRWVEVQRKIVTGINGTSKYYIFTGTDITQKVEAEQKKIESDEKYKMLIDNIPHITWICGEDFSTKYVSSNVERILGFKPEEFAANSFDIWFKRMHDSQRDSVIESFEQLFKSDGIYNEIYLWQHKDGHYIWLEDKALNKFYDDGMMYAFGTITDVTHFKNIENEIMNSKKELEEVLNYKENFFNILTQDLIEPFNGFMNLLKAMTTNFDRIPMIELQNLSVAIKQSAEHVYKLIENTLDWTKSQSGRLTAYKNIFNICEELSEVIETLANIAEQKNIQLEIDCIQDTFVFADVNMIKTAFRNVLSNAIKFTPNNGRVKIKLIDSSNLVTIEVADTGIGIEPDRLHKIFNLSRDISSFGTYGEKGSGLGLILAKEFIAMNGGTITIDSYLGRGTTVRLTIPKFVPEIQ